MLELHEEDSTFRPVLGDGVESETGSTPDDPVVSEPHRSAGSTAEKQRRWLRGGSSTPSTPSFGACPRRLLLCKASHRAAIYDMSP